MIMDFKGEARARIETTELLKDQGKNQALAKKRVDYDRQRVLGMQQAQSNSEALARFKALRPEEVLKDLRRAWGVGRVMDSSDASENAPLGYYLSIGGMVLYQRGNRKDSTSSHGGGYAAARGFDDHIIEGGRGEWIRPSTVKTEMYPIDIAGIYLVMDDHPYPNTNFKVEVVDTTGTFTRWETTTKTGFFSSENKVDTKYTPTSLSNRPRSYTRFDLARVTQEDICAFFVETTAARMAGKGNIRIR